MALLSTQAKQSDGLLMFLPKLGIQQKPWVFKSQEFVPELGGFFSFFQRMDIDLIEFGGSILHNIE
jgi:hypothetical protein